MLDERMRVENYRDVGEWVNVLAGEQILRPGTLLRGGSIQSLTSLEVIGHPRTILNLQFNPDPVWEGVTNIHLPSPREAGDVYETSLSDVRRWLRAVLTALEEGARTPVYVHCHSGRDRTGVVIAALLRVLGVDEEVIVLEYTASDGVPGEQTIRRSLADIGDPGEFFHGLEPSPLRSLFMM